MSLQQVAKKLYTAVTRLKSALDEPLSDLHRIKLYVFYVTVLQIRDSVNRIARTNDVEDITFFQWEKPDQLIVKVNSFAAVYSWEYQGIWEIFVRTANTYRMMNTVSFFLARYPTVGLVGEALSGKTALLQAMARVLGRDLRVQSKSN